MWIGDSWAVELAGFGKRYRRDWRGRTSDAVQELTLKVAPGQVLGLLGPNGSGKSTTLKALAGLIAPTTGECRIFGHLAGSDRARACVGYLPDGLHFPSGYSAREILGYYAALSSMPASATAGRINSVLVWAGLRAVADEKVGTFSKGMRQRLGLAQAILHEPQVVLLDEPASGLDPEGRIALGRLVRELAGQGRTVVFSSHLLAQAENICDRLAILGQGRLLAEGSPEKLLGPDRAAAAESSPLEKLYLEKMNARY
jgi:ABC-2 type transport system ATP-binding protein